MKNTPEFDLLKASHKALVRKLGNTEDHTIVVQEGTAGKGWNDLNDLGWIRIREDLSGYAVQFTLTGWEWWCRQVDAEEGVPLQALAFTDLM